MADTKESSERPLVSIIVRTKDRPQLLKNALRSIASQKYRPIEVVLVNDGGCDLDIEEIKTILDDIALNYIRLEKNTGRSHAGNVGIENVKGQYIGFLDDDDEFYPEHISLMVHCVSNVDYRIVYTDCELIYMEFDPKTGSLIETGKQPFVSKDFRLENLLAENHIPLMNILFHHDELNAAVRFDETFDVYEDWDLLIRCAYRTHFFHIKKITTRYVQWSRDMQVAQSDMSIDKRTLAYDRILEKHRDKFTPNVLRYFFHFMVQTEQLNNAVNDRDIKLLSLTEELNKSIAERDIKISSLTEQLSRNIAERDAKILSLAEELNKSIYERDAKISLLTGQLSRNIAERDNKILSLAEEMNRAVSERDAKISILSDTIYRLEKDIGTKDAFISALNNTLTNKDLKINALEKTLADQQSAILRLEAEIDEKFMAIKNAETVLQDIYRSNGWRALTAYYKIRDRILPKGSKRRQTVKGIKDLFTGSLKLLSFTNIKKSILYIRQYGINAWMIKANKKIAEQSESQFHMPDAPEVLFNKKKPVELSLFSDVNVSVIIPTFNAGSEFEQLLSMLQLQQGINAIEIIIVDSGSTDGTAETARAKGARLVQISQEEFSHSHARNLGSGHATGNYLLFMVQDAMPPSSTWLWELVKALKDNQVIAVSCAETPREDVDLLYRVLSWNHIRFLGIEKHDRILSNPEVETPASLRKNGQLSDVACLISREVFQKYGYRYNYAEDLDLGVRLVKDGYKLALLSSISIIHSHNRPCSYYLKRWYAETIILPKIIPGIPEEPIEYASLAYDMIFTLYVLSVLLLNRLNAITLPINPRDLALIISNTIQSSMTISLPERAPSCSYLIADEEFCRLFNIITAPYSAVRYEGTYNGKLLRSVLSFMGIVFDYLSVTYDLLYENELDEIKTCLHKVFAFQCGAAVAYCFLSCDSETKALLEPVDKELMKGI